MFFRTGYNHDTDLASEEAGLSCDVGEGRTHQSFAEESDINTIVRRFGLTGEIPEGFSMPQSGDFTGVSDFQTAMNVVVAAQEAFMELPGTLRARFGHDPNVLLAFLADENNRGEALRLGLIAAPPERTRDVVQAIDELAGQLVPKPVKA